MTPPFHCLPPLTTTRSNTPDTISHRSSPMTDARVKSWVESRPKRTRRTPENLRSHLVSPTQTVHETATTTFENMAPPPRSSSLSPHTPAATTSPKSYSQRTPLPKLTPVSTPSRLPRPASSRTSSPHSTPNPNARVPLHSAIARNVAGRSATAPRASASLLRPPIKVGSYSSPFPPSIRWTDHGATAFAETARSNSTLSES
jgi:hypothetical protein